jgi:hypothetical protein
MSEALVIAIFRALLAALIAIQIMLASDYAREYETRQYPGRAMLNGIPKVKKISRRPAFEASQTCYGAPFVEDGARPRRRPNMSCVKANI